MLSINTNNIALALSLNYKKEFLLPFIKSFEKHASGILYIITDLPEYIFNCKNIKLVNIFNLLKTYNIPPSITPFNLKPILFYLFLKQFNESCNVLITDVDVIFQRDPFKIESTLKESTFVLTEEKKLFKDCDVNSTWLKVSYPELFNEFMEYRILNSGVVYGKKDVIQDYFKKMAYEMQSTLPKCNYPILDQIILNVLFYKKKNISPYILSHNNGYMVHLSQVKDEEITAANITKNNTFIYNNIENCIVHQYNKKPFLDGFFKNLHTEI